MSVHSALQVMSPSSRLLYDGDETRYEIWLCKFMGHLPIQKLHEVISAADPKTVDPAKNAEVFIQLAIFLDDKSLSLIM